MLIALDGENYVFWGGREGYMSLLNTNMKQELDNFGNFLRMARDYARAQGFEGSFFIEPSPQSQASISMTLMRQPSSGSCNNKD